MSERPELSPQIVCTIYLFREINVQKCELNKANHSQ